MRKILIVWTLSMFGMTTSQQASSQAPVGEILGRALEHTADSRQAVVASASVALPAAATGGKKFIGKFAELPPLSGTRVPVVLFLHGSSGLGLKAIGEWQAWLADLGVASIAPDSMVLPDRVTYKSPIDRNTYEKLHTLRYSEIEITREALSRTTWADMSKVVLAGASEGGVPVARETGVWAGRMIFSWSCENNYFVEEHRTHKMTEPVLNVMSSTDVYFSPENVWLDNPGAVGHCGPALKSHKAATILLVPGAPHTLLNIPSVQMVTKGWLIDLFKL